MSSSQGAIRGRPRDPDVSRAILEATTRLLGEHGYAGTSVGRVAAAAGVGKTAIYRRFRDKAELVAAAMADLRRVDETVDTGSARDDLAEQLRRSVAAMTEGPGLGLTLAGTLLVERERTPELVAAVRAHVIEPLLDAGRQALRRGIERGEVRADADVDAALEALFGQLLTRAMDGLGFAPGWVDRAIDVVFRGIEAQASDTGGIP